MLKITKMLTVVVAVLGLVSVSNAAITAESWLGGVPGGAWDSFDVSIAYGGSGNWPNWGDDMYITWLAAPNDRDGHLTIDDGFTATGGFCQIGTTGGASALNDADVTVTGAGSIFSPEELAVHWFLDILDGGLAMVGWLDINNNPYTEGVRMTVGGQLALKGAASDTLANFLESVHGNGGSAYLKYWDGASWASMIGIPGDEYTLEAGTGDLDGYGVLTIVPEPATMALLALGGLGVLLRRRSRKA